MEQIIPILIAAVVFGIQAYANYQKEQEKAKKRNLGKPRTEEFPEFESYEEVVVIDDPVLGPTPTPAAARPSTASRSQETRSSTPDPNLYARYEGTVDPRRNSRSTKKTDSIPDVKLADLDEDDQTPFAVEEEFDLRKAVIASIILERPYRD